MSIKCKLDEGHWVCGGRINRGGVIVSDNYGKVTAAALDPIEKALYHFYPGNKIFSPWKLRM